MGVRLVVAVTDGDWYEMLRQQSLLDEVNFWAPGASPFRALQPGELFLFKLHSPRNFIVGGGIFAHWTEMPCSLAWEAFGIANGARSLAEMRERIVKYRRNDPDRRQDFRIGCRILTQPFFLDEIEWLPVPDSWKPNIVSFKTYSTDETDGRHLWERLQRALSAESHRKRLRDIDDESRYGEPQLVRPRLGQGAFRLLVTDTYGRRCAVTHERTLPALEAAHIRPYSEGGQHEINNGMLLRRDIHSLFDAGYVTVTPDLRFEVSRKIKEEFENGRDYYRLHGSQIDAPKEPNYQPSATALSWHNNSRYLG